MQREDRRGSHHSALPSPWPLPRGCPPPSSLASQESRGPPRRAQKLSTARGCPKNSSHRYFRLLLPPATTHVVPLVEVDGAGDGGEALVAVVVVGVQGGGDAAMTNLGEREAEGEGERRQLGREPRAPRRPAVNSGQFAPGETEERGQPRRAEGSSKQRPLLG